jgi:hypothetical protein
MRRLLFAAAVLIAAMPARADFDIRDGNGDKKTEEAFTHSGKILRKFVPVDSSGNEVTPATSSGLDTLHTDLGEPGSTVCATDTGSCSLNALIQRALQRLTTIDSTLGTPLQAGGTVAATQSGTWTVQPGNSANTTPWLFTISQGGNSAAVSAAGALKVDGSAVTQPISAASLPLPSGAATAANQATANTSLASLVSNTTGLSTASNQSTANTSLASIDTKLSSQATAANQSTANSSLSSIDTKLSSQATASNQSTANSSLASLITNTTGLATASNQSTANSSLASIATNTTGLATAANQSTANTSLSSIATNTSSTATNTSTANTNVGAPGATACATDTGSCSLNALLQRLAQRATSLIAVFTTKSAGVPATAADAGIVVAARTYQSAGASQFGLAIGTNTTLTVPANTLCALMTLEGANIRRTSDGTSASSSVGTLIQAGTQWTDCGPLASYKHTLVSGSPTLTAEYLK